MVRVGDKFNEKLPSFVKSKTGLFPWVIEVVGFHHESYGVFADCIRRENGYKDDKLAISIGLLDDRKETFYKKIATNN